MKLIESPFLSADILPAQVNGPPLRPAEWRPHEEVSLHREEGTLLLLQGDRVGYLGLLPESASLEFHAANKEAIWLLSGHKQDRVNLRYLLPLKTQGLRVLEIAVDTRAADALHLTRQIASATVGQARDWLAEEFIWQRGAASNSRAFMAIQERADAGEMQLYGRRHVLDLSWGVDGVLRYERVARRTLSADLPYVLLEGDIRFSDATLGLKLEGAQSRASLATAGSTFGTYLELWSLYGAREWQRVVMQAAEIQAVHYSRQERFDEGGGWRLMGDAAAFRQMRERWKALAGDDGEAEIDEFAPDWQSERYTAPEHVERRNPPRGRLHWRADCIEFVTSASASPRELPDAGYLYLSLAGNRTAQSRRISARRAIESGSGVPALQRLLQDLPLPTQRPSRLPGLTPYARQSFQNGAPTGRQVDALAVALNTPDVALIIGPPGTGKTQVIAALERRLSELNEGLVISQEVLISSFQHDAVENALERTDVYGLPAIKVGGARRRESQDPVETWRQRRLSHAEARFEEAKARDPAFAALEELERLLVSLLVVGVPPVSRMGSLARVGELIGQLSNDAQICVSFAWRQQWKEAVSGLVTAAPVTRLQAPARLRQFRRLARALRSNATSFADDGPQRAMDALVQMEVSPGALSAQEQALLNRVRTLEEPSAIDLQEILALQQALLIRLKPEHRDLAQRNRLPESVCQLLQALQTELIDRVQASQLGRAAAMQRYVEALEGQPSRVRQAVAQYSAIVGATCQQSVSRQMALLKEGSEDAMASLRFTSVIIDEAARANPLDLFIPMALAKRRIILVGDPRQLPHLLDADIEEEIRAERGEQVSSQTYQQSLFERLWRQFEKRKNSDGFSRVVMLDTQFRMHPRLGDFVSAQFYEHAGLGKVHSGRPESDFMAQVPGFGAPVAVWIDVPARLGPEEQHGTSRRRTSEAKRIAVEVRRLLADLPDTMSIGVITFYAAQRDAIYQALATTDSPIAEHGEQGWSVCGDFASNAACSERLRIGTVDAFQGKEFDVVLLSTVRSNERKVALPALSANEQVLAEFERQASGRYGHLRSSNRLNVAMSRQRRLLVAVGNQQMFSDELAARAVPEMHAFMSLCEQEARHG